VVSVPRSRALSRVYISARLLAPCHDERQNRFDISSRRGSFDGTDESGARCAPQHPLRPPLSSVLSTLPLPPRSLSFLAHSSCSPSAARTFRESDRTRLGHSRSLSLSLSLFFLRGHRKPASIGELSRFDVSGNRYRIIKRGVGASASSTPRVPQAPRTSVESVSPSV